MPVPQRNQIVGDRGVPLPLCLLTQGRLTHKTRTDTFLSVAKFRAKLRYGESTAISEKLWEVAKCER